MRKAKVLVNGVLAGVLTETDEKNEYFFEYQDDYQGPPVSLTMPRVEKVHRFNSFPPFFEGLLPEGPQLEALLRQAKLDRNDHFGQIVTVGKDVVGFVTIEAMS